MAGKNQKTVATTAVKKTAAPAPETAVTKPAKAKTGSEAKSSGNTIDFVLAAPDAKDVCVAGEFNSWNVSEHKMRRSKDGIFKKSIQLGPGRYEYLFIVDGNWWTDPKNSESVPNSFGTHNSVLNV